MPSPKNKKDRRKANASHPGDAKTKRRALDELMSTGMPSTPQKKPRVSPATAAGSASPSTKQQNAAGSRDTKKIMDHLDMALLMQKLGDVLKQGLDPHDTAAAMNRICDAFAASRVAFDGDHFSFLNANQAHVEQLSIDVRIMVLLTNSTVDRITQRGEKSLKRFGLAATCEDSIMSMMQEFGDKRMEAARRIPTICVLLASIKLAQEAINAQQRSLAKSDPLDRRSCLRLGSEVPLSATFDVGCQLPLKAFSYLDLTIYQDIVAAESLLAYDKALREGRSDTGAISATSLIKIVEVKTPDTIDNVTSKLQGVLQGAAHLEQSGKPFVVTVLTDGSKYMIIFMQRPKTGTAGFLAYVSRPYIWERESGRVLGMLAHLIESQVLSAEVPPNLFMFLEEKSVGFFDNH